jgi:2-polyprenyl-3-methyl-5-hydroxy-6-metoxy-1,4-benzoquinol methylase
MNIRFLSLALLASTALSTSLGCAQTISENSPVRKDVPYVPTPEAVVERMLEMAGVTSKDVVYDLGCGDGRIVIAAARRGARGVGIDIDPERIRESKANAAAEGVSQRVKFAVQDLFETDMSEATVVTLYLLSSVNLKLRPKLLSELKPGTRIVSHAFDMGDWKPEQTAEVDGNRIYFWIVPERGQEIEKR